MSVKRLKHAFWRRYLIANSACAFWPCSNLRRTDIPLASRSATDTAVDPTYVMAQGFLYALLLAHVIHSNFHIDCKRILECRPGVCFRRHAQVCFRKMQTLTLEKSHCLPQQTDIPKQLSPGGPGHRSPLSLIDYSGCLILGNRDTPAQIVDCQSSCKLGIKTKLGSSFYHGRLVIVLGQKLDRVIHMLMPRLSLYEQRPSWPWLALP